MSTHSGMNMKSIPSVPGKNTLVLAGYNAKQISVAGDVVLSGCEQRPGGLSKAK